MKILTKMNGITKILLWICLLVVSFFVGKRFVDDKQTVLMDEEITYKVETKLKDYLDTYMTKDTQSGITVSTLTKETAAINLTPEEREIIIESITGVLEPKLYSQMGSISDTIQKNAVIELEKKLSESINTVVDTKLAETVVFSEDEKTLLENSIITVVEKSILEELKKSENKNTAAIEVLKDNINTNITRIENVLQKYEAKLESMNSTIQKLETQVNQQNVSDNSNVSSLEKQLGLLQESYSEFQKQYAINLANTLLMSNMITSLDDITDPDKQVLSASVGQELANQLIQFKTENNTKLAELELCLNEDIKEQINSMDKRVLTIEQELKNNLMELESKTATKEQLEKEKQLLQNALQATEQALSSQTEENINKAKEALEKTVNELGDTTSEELKEAKKALEEALASNQADTTQEFTNIKTAISNDVNTTNAKIAGIEDEINELNNTVTDIKSKLNVLDSKVTDNLEEIKQNTATKEQLQEEKLALKQLIENTEAAINSKSEEDILALIDSINAMGDNASAELIEAKENLEKVIAENKDDVTDELNAINNVVANNFASVESNIIDIENNISSLDNDITGIHEQMEILENSQPTYTWSTENGVKKVTILIP